MSYPLDHSRGFAMLPRDAASFEPLIHDHSALAIYIVLMCRVRNTLRMARGSHGVVELKAGQCVAGTRELAEAVGLAHSTARRALDRLEALGLIVRAATQRGAVITMQEYGDFSDVQPASGTAPAQGRAQLRHRVEHSSGTGSSTAPAPKDREIGDREIGDREIEPLTPSGTLRADGPAMVSHPPDAPAVCHESAQDAPCSPELFPVDQLPTTAKKRRAESLSRASEEQLAKARALAWALVTEINSHLPRAQRCDPHAKYLLKPALALVRDGHTADEARLVARAMAERWLGDPKMRQYYKPSTLLVRAKFAERLAEDVPRMGALGYQPSSKAQARAQGLADVDAMIAAVGQAQREMDRSDS